MCSEGREVKQNLPSAATPPIPCRYMLDVIHAGIHAVTCTAQATPNWKVYMATKLKNLCSS